MPPCSRLWTTRASSSSLVVDAEDRGDAVVRPARRRVGVPLGGGAVRCRDRVRRPRSAGTILNVQPAASNFARSRPRPSCRCHRRRTRRERDRDEPEQDAHDGGDDPRPPATTSSLDVGVRCFGALTRGFSAMPRANVAAAPVQPRLRKRRRPPTRYRASTRWSSSLSSSVSRSARSPSSSPCVPRSSSAGAACRR